jgi:SAM-dependent methyltransferase
MALSLNKSSYDAIADEYYDSRHITSRNFDDATIEFCNTAKDKFPIPQKGFVLEVGCGKGSVNRYFNINLDRVVQTDISLKMLKIHPREEPICTIQCNAVGLPFQDSAFAAVFAFLYDPYNVEEFYSEFEKVLTPSGVFIGTLPHFKWGSLLRSGLSIDRNRTQFRRFTSMKDKDFVELDSFLVDDDQIRQLLMRAKFKQIEMSDLYLPLHIKTISPHIELPASLLGISPYDLPIVKMIIAKK